MNEKMINQPAPNFTLPSSDGELVSLKTFRGQKVIVYFYPKDETRGCSLEANGFKELNYDFQDKEVSILGISPDDTKSHQRFAKNLDLPFPLLSDIEHQVAELYGVWEQKTMYGKSYWGVERTTFLIDEKGYVRNILKNLKPEEHAKAALELIDEI
jgi:peroxiredoxin Q/BCP